jgi:hypothetical protein
MVAGPRGNHTQWWCVVRSSDAEEDEEGVDVDTAMTVLEDSDLVHHDDVQAGCFIFDQSAVLLMARSLSNDCYNYAC